MSLQLTLACGAYDRTFALAQGSVRPAGIELTYLQLPVEETFWRMTRRHEFDAAEMSMSSYLVRRARGDDSLMAIPVFTSRFFRHSCVFVNAQAGIQRPEDLKGKRVGVPEYQITANVWIRGFLEDDYGVAPADIRWIQGGLEQTGRVEKLSISIPGVSIEPIGPDQTLSQMLASGEIDAAIGARTPSTFDGQRVVRLFPDYRQVEQAYFERTRIFPIMHAVVIRKSLLERAPWVARSLFEACVQAKEWWMAEMSQTSALAVMLPWMVAELEDTRRILGDDYWPYGVEPNRPALEALVRYSHAQGLAERLLSVDELFVPSTLDEYRI
jgi:4,5-dihydroxyphthalate decarboxylase